MNLRQRLDEIRQLERELAAAQARIAELEAALTATETTLAGANAAWREATARAESAERDALQRAAEVCNQMALKASTSVTYDRYIDCRNAILALIPKERT